MAERDRGRRNSNDRGSAAARRARKQWLLDRDGDGTTAPCHECGAVVSFDTMCVDRHPIPGEQGGRYTRDNIAVHCVGCSGRQGQRRTVAILAERRACAD
ncbi:HNH endonuclease [Gordonia phage CloverMinnie]|nr:HNH endonuclease [Gordonia phage CloverMinnie]